MDEAKHQWIKELKDKASQELSRSKDTLGNPDSLHIKDRFQSADGQERVNTLKIKPLQDGSGFQIWLGNGTYWGTFRLTPDGAKEMVEFFTKYSKC